MPATNHVPDETGHCRVDGLLWPSEDPQAVAELLRDYAEDLRALLIYLSQHIVTAARRDPRRHWTDIAAQYIGCLPREALAHGSRWSA